MGPFRWLEAPGQLESLAVCLRSLKAQAGSPASYDDLLVSLGLGSLVVCDARLPVAEWPTLARDELLVVTAQEAGVRLRELHPRRAAVGLETSDEFRLHFIDSYLPLIERALSTGQLALAWRGWPPPHDGQWGVITFCSDQIAGGFTLGQSVEPLTLLAPAQQVYIVEEAGIPMPAHSAADAVARAAWALHAQETGGWGSDPALCTGSRAWREWERVLREGAAEISAHGYAAVAVAAARESMGRWLRQRSGELSGAVREAVTTWGHCCEDVAQRLRGTIPADGEARPDAAKWRDATLRTLNELSELDARAAEIVAPHARPIAIRPAYEPDPLQV